MRVIRDVGEEVPISIGTSVAITKAFLEVDVYPEQLWINLRTLFRNFHGAMTNKMIINSEDIYIDLVEEMRMIEDVVQTSSGDRTEVVFYYSSYRALPSIFPKAILREPTTAKQIDYAVLEREVLEYLLADEDIEVPPRRFDVKIKGDDKEALIITSFPVDLLSKREFSKLTLLETHTGKMKRENSWNSKLTSGKNFPRLPFNALTLQIYGDSGNHFAAMPSSVKKTLYEIAETNKWSGLTTHAKVLFNINSMRDVVLADIFKLMLRAQVK